MIDRQTLIEDIADSKTNSASKKELLQLFYDDQVGFLSGLTDEELIIHGTSSLGINENDIKDIYAQGKK